MTIHCCLFWDVTYLQKKSKLEICCKSSLMQLNRTAVLCGISLGRISARLYAENIWISRLQSTFGRNKMKNCCARQFGTKTRAYKITRGLVGTKYAQQKERSVTICDTRSRETGPLCIRWRLFRKFVCKMKITNLLRRERSSNWQTMGGRLTAEFLNKWTGKLTGFIGLI